MNCNMFFLLPVYACFACLVFTGPVLAKSGDFHSAREPLSFNDMGLYGGWNEYWFDDNCPFNFFVVQARVDAAGKLGSHGMAESTSWNNWLKRARTKGYRIIAVVEPAGWQTAPDKLAAFKAGIDRFMKSVDEKLLYAITLAEEGIYWDGHQEVYLETYKYVKKTYDVPAYQWYSPYAGAPGFGWPQLPADGWVTDEYARGGPSYESFIRSYVVHQLPVVHIVWASPLMRDFNWEKDGEPAFDWQVEVNRKYNIPTLFFAWEGHDNTWGWSPEALPDSKAVYKRAVEWARRASYVNLKSYEDTWDSMPGLRPQQIAPKADGTFIFEQDFKSGGGLVPYGAVTQGFRDVRWDGGPLELRPRKSGRAIVEMHYPLQSDFLMKNVSVTITGKIERRLGGSIKLAMSTDGAVWTKPQSLGTDGKLIVSLSQNPMFSSSRNLEIKLVLSGKVKNAGDVAASVESIKVEGVIVPPLEKEIRLQLHPGIDLKWSTGYPGASAIFTADVENAGGLANGGNELGIQGVDGSPNTVRIIQRFVCNSKIDLYKIYTKNTADGVNYGSSNLVGISLDGKSILLEKTTSGIANGEDLIIDVSGDKKFKNIREFYVHMTMACNSGIAGPISNRITKLTIEGKGSKAE